jgi:hypothetical protein
VLLPALVPLACHLLKVCLVIISWFQCLPCMKFNLEYYLCLFYFLQVCACLQCLRFCHPNTGQHSCLLFLMEPLSSLSCSPFSLSLNRWLDTQNVILKYICVAFCYLDNT